jgi:hypothetical protein
LARKNRNGTHPLATHASLRLPPGPIPPLANASKAQTWPGDPNACAYCQRSDVPMTRDHVIPQRRGGPSVPVNVVDACRPCNQAKAGIIPLGVQIVRVGDGYELAVDWGLLRAEVSNFVQYPAYRRRRERGWFGSRGDRMSDSRLRGGVSAAVEHLSAKRRAWLTMTDDPKELE